MTKWKTLLIATTNQHKLIEIRDLLTGIPVNFKTLLEFPSIQEPEETGATFAENARLKAIYYSCQTGELSIAEDSGLEIDALDGAPGVLSSRFNGASYPDKFSAIYKQLRERNADGSAARFICCLAVADGQQIEFETRGSIEGQIAATPKGADGFGYDPIFFYPSYDRTLAEVSLAEKAAVSHRGQAFRELRTFLKNW
jgi:XTP/dITP diphosphohydrolase